MDITGIPMSIEETALLRLQSWLSPAFPVGAYAYSHGLEYAVEAGLVRDLEGLSDWLAGILRHGGARTDAMAFAAAWRALEADGAGDELLAAAELAAALRGTRELALESAAQGAAFLSTVGTVWPHPLLDEANALLKSGDIDIAAPVAVAVACAAHGIPLRPALAIYLQAFAANLIHAAVRLIPLGQTDAQRAGARLEPLIIDLTEAALASDPDDIGTAALVVDWTSMQHETQHTRLFRS